MAIGHSFSHGRTASEALLASLSSDDYFCSRHAAASLVSDDDLAAWCPPLGKSVVEEREAAFVKSAVAALAHMSPSSSSSSSSTSSSCSSSSSLYSNDGAYFDMARTRQYSSSYYSPSCSSSLASGASTPALDSSRCLTPSGESSLAQRRGFPLGALHLASLPSPTAFMTTSSSSSSSSAVCDPPALASTAPKSPWQFPCPCPCPSSTKRVVVPRSSARRGLLLNNFGGIDTGRRASPGRDDEDDDDVAAPVTPVLRVRRSTGFAF